MILMTAVACETLAMAWRRRSRLSDIRATGEAPGDLYDYARPHARRPGRPVADDPSTWTVTDDWPEDVPVSLYRAAPV